MTFTTSVLCASFILFGGFHTTDVINTMSLICGFLVTFTGVYLLNLSRSDPNGDRMLARRGAGDATGTDMVSSIQTRLSMQGRRSTDPHRLSVSSQHGDRQGLIRAYDEEAAAEFGLTDLAEESEDEMARLNGTANGHSKTYEDSIELQPQKVSDR